VRLRDANGTDVDIGTVDRHPACCGVLFFDAPDTATDTISERSPISEPDPNSDDVADPNPDHVADADPSAHIADIADIGAANPRHRVLSVQREFHCASDVQPESNHCRRRRNRHLAQRRQHGTHVDRGWWPLELRDDSPRRIIQHPIPNGRHLHVSLRDSPQYGWDRHRAVARWRRGSRASSGMSY
jgi:hypothetical protein